MVTWSSKWDIINKISKFGGGKFEGSGSAYGVETVFLGDTSYSIVQILFVWDVSFSHNTLPHRQTDGQTDRWHYDGNSWSRCVAVKSAKNFW